MDDFINQFLKSKNLYRDILVKVSPIIFIYDVLEQNLIWSNKTIKYPKLRKMKIDKDIKEGIKFLMSPIIVCQLIQSINRGNSFRGIFRLSYHGNFQFFEAVIDPLRFEEHQKIRYILAIANSLPNPDFDNLENAKIYFKRNEELLNELIGKDKYGLTKREVEIIRLIAEGHTTPEIADKLFISHSTVEKHRNNIRDKIPEHNITSFITSLYKQGLGLESFAPNG